MATVGSSFDQTLLAEIEQDIAGFSGYLSRLDVEDQILALADEAKGSKDEALRRGEICYEFVNSRIYPMVKQYLVDIERREHRKFEEAESDPNDHLRNNWRTTKALADEIINNWERGAEFYVEALRNGVPDTSVQQ
jgi:hypothetical protein